ncbi:MAG TPA: preprotein translocase subunit SecG [Steroidobacteraceae bacterium]|jgi:preprotein translocase subunit SecG
MHIVLTIVQVVASISIIGLVLLQRGKGADAGAGFGAGASGTVFGAKGATTALSRATAIFAAIFMVNSLALAYMGTRAAAEQPKGLLDQAVIPDTNTKKGANPAGGVPAPTTTVPSTTSAPPPSGAAPAQAPATGSPATGNAAPAPVAPSSSPAAPAAPTPAAPAK